MMLGLQRFGDPFLMILGSFGEPVGAKISLGASCGTHGSPKWLPESPRVPFWSMWGSFWVHFGASNHAKIGAPKMYFSILDFVRFGCVLGSKIESES